MASIRPHDDAGQEFGLLRLAWEEVRLKWRDDMARRFESMHWMHIRNESEDYVRSLHDLVELLHAAERDTE
jgi:hypothetical protein